MKTCRKCNESKGLSQFANQKSREDGKYPYCKPCERERELSYRRTKRGLVANIYSNQISNSKTRGMDKPEYNLEQLRGWCFSQNIFHSLYDKWVASDYDRRKAPSCDRLNMSKGYDLDNIELVEFKENEKRYRGRPIKWKVYPA